ncbi:MAG TPA: hypothetical protein VMH84_06160 [Xanthobacteraceae bacterium]|nr:hypothetical protein [Xanthobacteraceae bacterium]
MASKRNPSDPAGSSARPPRKPSTIDLEATEVASETPSQSPGASTSAAPDPSDDNEPPYTEAPKHEGITWLPSGRPSLLGAAGMGAVSMLILISVLWFSGVIGNGSAGYGDRLSAIESRLRELALRPADRADQHVLEDLSTRIGRLEKSTFSPPPPPLSDPALANRLASAENATKAFADNIGSLNSRVDDLAAAVRELRNVTPVDKSEVEALAARIAALEKTAAAIEADLAKRATVASDRAMRYALATAALRTAVERGDPFTVELAAARPLAPENALSGLEPFAASGVPGNAVLAQELSALVPALRRAADSVPPEGGFFDRLKANAGRLVRIRRADEVPGDDPAAVITRIDLKAANADVSGALVELAKLPAPVRAPAQAWIDKAQARIAAVEESRKIAAAAISALGNASP